MTKLLQTLTYTVQDRARHLSTEQASRQITHWCPLSAMATQDAFFASAGNGSCNISCRAFEISCEVRWRAMPNRTYAVCFFQSSTRTSAAIFWCPLDMLWGNAEIERVVSLSQPAKPDLSTHRFESRSAKNAGVGLSTPAEYLMFVQIRSGFNQNCSKAEDASSMLGAGRAADCWYLSVEAALKEFGESLGAPVDFRKKLAQYCNEHVLPTWRNPHIAAGRSTSGARS